MNLMRAILDQAPTEIDRLTAELKALDGTMDLMRSKRAALQSLLGVAQLERDKEQL